MGDALKRKSDLLKQLAEGNISEEDVLLYPLKQLGNLDHQKLLKSKKNTAQLRIKQLVATCLLKATQLQLSSFTRVPLFAKKVDATNLLAMVIITTRSCSQSP